MHAKLLCHVWFCVTVYVDCRPPGSFVHEVSQVRILEWVATSLSRGSSRSRDQTFVLLAGDCHLGSPNTLVHYLFKIKKNYFFLVALGLCSEWGLLFFVVCGLFTVGASRCGAQTLGAVVVAGRLSYSRHVESFPTRDATYVPCTNRWILIHCTTKEVLVHNL